jgi:hypothetical protein
MSDNRAQSILIALKKNAADWMFEPDHDVTSADVLEAHLKHLDDELAKVKAERNELRAAAKAAARYIGMVAGEVDNENAALAIQEKLLTAIEFTKGTNK